MFGFSFYADICFFLKAEEALRTENLFVVCSMCVPVLLGKVHTESL